VFPDIPDLASYDAIFADEAIVRPTIDALLEEAGWSGERVERMPGGSSFVYAVGDDLVFKATAPLFTEEALIELPMLRATHDARLGVPTPEVVADGVTRGWPWMMMTRLGGEGGMEAWAEVPRSDRLAIAERLGAWMRASHEDPLIQAVALPGRWMDWARTQSELRAKLIATHQRSGTPPEWLEQLEPFMEDWNPVSESPVIHADLHPGNLRFEQRSGRWTLCGILDFADALCAPALYDMAAPLVFMAEGDAELTRILAREVLGMNVPGRLLWQWILLHRFSNLAYYLERAKGPQARDLEALGEAVLGR